MMKDYTKFKEMAKAYLCTRSIGDLRIYGREIGAFRPTDCKKAILIDQIVGILAEEIEPIERNRRGAPIKNDVVPPEIPARIRELYQKYVLGEEPYKDKNVHYLPTHIRRRWEFNDPSAPKVEYIDGQQAVYRGQVYFDEETCVLLPLNATDGFPQFIEKDMVRYYGLREGDVVSFYGERTEKGIYATEILTINETSLAYFNRRNFDELIACYPFERIHFYDEEQFAPQDITAKYLEWLLPLGKGQRTCVFGAPKSGKSTLLCKMAQYAQRYNRELKVFVALVDQTPEDVGKYRKVADDENFVFATYEDEPERQIFLADFMLARARAYAESGKNALLIVDSIGGLARAYNETEESSGGKVLPCGLESKTLRYVKKFLGAGRCFEEGGSLTVVSALTTDTGSEIDDVLERELSAITNAHVHLSNRLAMAHVYPAIDYQKTEVKECGLLQISEEIELQNYLRTQYLPEKGIAELYGALQSSYTYAEFKETLLKK